jgi:uncharacterized protein (DUF1800 family)
MALDPHVTVAALHRFGLGGKPGDYIRAALDPRGYVLQQLRRKDAALLVDPTLASSDANLRQMQVFDEMRRRRDLEKAYPPYAAPQMANMFAAAASVGLPPMPDISDQKVFRDEVTARFNRMATTEEPFVERLVMFWMNHFAVAVNKSTGLRAATGAYEREAIRPYVLGRFSDMLLAVEQHPVMLLYLDNAASIGPNSRAGNNGQRGLNENLAREILELHTLGVGGGYSQDDVKALARILTGWTLSQPGDDAVNGGRFTFAPNRHEPGDHIMLGKSYRENGVEQGREALRDIARHPSTAKHIAFKLVRHFVADEPPPALVARLTKVFQETDGDLAAVSTALVQAPEAWAPQATKLRSPLEFIGAALRATGRAPEFQPLAGWLNALGQPVWQPLGPDGFSDQSSYWSAPEGISARLDVAFQLARQTPGTGNPIELLDAVFGPSVSVDTRQAVARAESRQQGLALMLMSPEFQRR